MCQFSKIVQRDVCRVICICVVDDIMEPSDQNGIVAFEFTQLIFCKAKDIELFVQLLDDVPRGVDAL